MGSCTKIIYCSKVRKYLCPYIHLKIFQIFQKNFFLNFFSFLRLKSFQLFQETLLSPIRIANHRIGYIRIRIIIHSLSSRKPDTPIHFQRYPIPQRRRFPHCPKHSTQDSQAHNQHSRPNPDLIFFLSFHSISFPKRQRYIRVPTSIKLPSKS